MLTHLCKLSSPQTLDNLFKGVLLNRFPSNADPAAKNEYLRHFTEAEYVQDPATGYQCPVDKALMMRAVRECPDKENLYPVQINSIKELQARWKGLRDTERVMHERLKKDVEEGEQMEREIDKVYFERTMKCA